MTTVVARAATVLHDDYDAMVPQIATKLKFRFQGGIPQRYGEKRQDFFVSHDPELKLKARRAKSAESRLLASRNGGRRRWKHSGVVQLGTLSS